MGGHFKDMSDELKGITVHAYETQDHVRFLVTDVDAGRVIEVRLSLADAYDFAKEVEQVSKTDEQLAEEAEEDGDPDVPTE